MLTMRCHTAHVPSDAKSLLDGAKTKMRTPRGYKDRYIASKGAYQYNRV